ncbi:hypothetical protein S40285_04309 [Stachybotrys chlorohalonatus IBT 40285]|uniref:Uncharacterized protein n=1 Tax=Stachybotrys chlorohalonatus (strain IBT 40285) TaxID=1283841 RepID=A0A084QQ87_STAC4|nr:hypothetical protein S40285_04309 [Stachybotrys chlorohalonata IBT 40285]
MTKLPSEAFLPSGAVDADVSLAHATEHHYSHANGSPPYVLAPYQPGATASVPGSRIHAHSIPRGSHSLFGRPDMLPLSAFSPTSAPAPPINYRPSHLSLSSLQPFDPTGQRPSASQSPAASVRSAKLSPSLGPVVGLRNSISRSVSADAAAPQQTSIHLVQRLAQQNTLIREAWEAERNYLEANRRRAEEVYQEERAIMEDVRDSWEDEKVVLLVEIQSLKERIQRLEGENTTLRAVATQTVQAAGLVSPFSDPRTTSGQQSGGVSSLTPTTVPARDFRQPHNPSVQAPSTHISDADASVLPPGLDGASRRPHFASPGASRMSPTAQPESSPFVPLEPRTQPQNSSPHDFLSSSSEDVETPVAVIDVHEIDPKLEGIPIKATAVQKSTFAEPSDNPSSAPSPPADTSVPQQPKPLPFKRVSSKEQTIQVLAAEESRRLTLHAGHTPNHSLSLFPTMTATDVGTSEGATPTISEPSGSLSAPDAARFSEKGKETEEAEPEHPKITDPDAPLPLGADVYPEPILDPADDVPLKGPLMIKNIPAQDEVFFSRLNAKLETISQGRDALPTVVRSSVSSETVADSLSMAGPSQHTSQTVAPVGGDASHDARSGPERDDEDTPGASQAPDVDVPLKLRTTTNFGAPFGVA